MELRASSLAEYVWRRNGQDEWQFQVIRKKSCL